MARTKKTFEPAFTKTCELIYKHASKRISEKYEEWNQSYGGGINGFCSTNRKVLGYILKCKPTKDNPYLLTPSLVQELLVNQDFFYDENEIYWGNDANEYLEDLFITVLLEMQESNDYTKYWMGIPLKTEIEIRDFYSNFIRDIEDVYESLKDAFVNFTFNSNEYFELVGEVGEIIKDSVDSKDSNKVLTFYKLPKKIAIYAEKILLPFISGICFNLFISSVEKASTE